MNRHSNGYAAKSDMTILRALAGSAIFLTALFIGGTNVQGQNNAPINSKTELRQLVVGGGCFWCVEAVYQSLRGVETVESGYAGGSVPNPSYEQVTTGTTGHAEVVRISYDAKIISYEELLEVFFHTHDPTTLNRQGNDVGTQYRSIIFYTSPDEKETAEKVRTKITQSGLWPDRIVTEIMPLSAFYLAEEYHQDYYNRHQSQPYCSIVIAPKLQKLYKQFRSKLKS